MLCWQQAPKSNLWPFKVWKISARNPGELLLVNTDHGWATFFSLLRATFLHGQPSGGHMPAVSEVKPDAMDVTLTLYSRPHKVRRVLHIPLHPSSWWARSIIIIHNSRAQIESFATLARKAAYSKNLNLPTPKKAPLNWIELIPMQMNIG